VTEAERLRRYGAATVLEAGGDEVGWLRGLHPVWSPAELAGPAFTVAALPTDNLPLHRALAECPPGVVLVAATGATVETAIWGEVLTVAAIERGVHGLVTDGGVRDVRRIRDLGFPVFAAQTTPAGPTKQTPGELAVPVTLAGVEVQPGDWIVADDDGVVVLASSALERTLREAHDRSARETGLMERIRAGELTVDLLGLRERMRS